MKTTRCISWHGRHKWGKWLAREVPHDIHLDQFTMRGIGNSRRSELDYTTRLSVLSRYCDRCDYKQTEHATLIRMAEITEED